jgi:hypothetical protein
MKPFVDLVISILTLLTLASGLYFALWRFGLKRERSTFMRLTIDAKKIREVGDLVLVEVTVHIENKGDTRIDARRERDENGYLYNIQPDVCRHAGTLKIRSVPRESKPLVFDWYSLPTLRAATRLVPVDKVVEDDADLEQINYLDEFQDPQTHFQESNFWAEPRESYDQPVFLWLRPGIYAAKAYFLGPGAKHQEEEYWSCQTLFTIGPEGSRSS